MSKMTTWELRGYLTYPNQYGKPSPGTREEMGWSIGWMRAQREDQECAKSQYHLDLENDALYGRNSYAVDYVSDGDKNNFQF